MSLAKLNDWKELRLDEVFDISRGGSPRPIKDFITESNEGYNWIKIGDTKKVDKYIYTTKQKIKKEGLKKTVLVQEDDFILSNSMSFGKPYIMKTEGCIHDGWLLMRRKSKDLSIDYMYYLLSSNVIKSQFKNKAAGSTVQNLNIKLVSTVKALIPSYKEQQKIADILSTVDAKIEVIDQQITETQDLKKGLMQRLLTKGIGHTEFKDSALGEIPVGWEVVKLGDISEVKGRIGYRGYTKLDLVEEGKGALAIGGAQITKQNKLSFSKAVYLNWEKYEESPEIKVEVGNIVFAQRGTLGRVALINFLPEKATINPSMVLIKNIDCNERFLFYYLCSTNVQNIVSQISTSTAVPMISQKQIKNFNIGMPSFQEQQKIATILGSVDEKLATLSEKKETYQELKKGLMQQLLTGKVRVKV
jgi:type I restriction enzyme S subunit